MIELILGGGRDLEGGRIGGRDHRLFAVVDGQLRLTYVQFGERCDRWSAAPVAAHWVPLITLGFWQFQ